MIYQSLACISLLDDVRYDRSNDGADDGPAWVSQASYAIHGRWLVVDCFYEWKLRLKRLKLQWQRSRGLSGGSPPPGVTWHKRRSNGPAERRRDIEDTGMTEKEKARSAAQVSIITEVLGFVYTCRRLIDLSNDCRRPLRRMTTWRRRGSGARGARRCWVACRLGT